MFVLNLLSYKVNIEKEKNVRYVKNVWWVAYTELKIHEEDVMFQ